MIFSSTGSIYRTDPNGAPLSEESPVGPINPYAATKLTVDMMLAGEATAFGLGAVSLRYFNAAGAVGDLGERHNPESHLIPIVLQAASGQRDELALYGDDYPTRDGTCIRDYIHVSDLASAHLLALAAMEPGRHEIFNLGNGSGYTNKQVIDTVQRVSGRDFPVEGDGSPPRRPDGRHRVEREGAPDARLEAGATGALRHHRRRVGVPLPAARDSAVVDDRLRRRRTVLTSGQPDGTLG